MMKTNINMAQTSDPLFKECIEALSVFLLPDSEAKNLSELFKATYPIIKWGKVDWSKIPNHKYIEGNQAQIVATLTDLIKKNNCDSTIFIEWSSAHYPVIKTNLKAVVEFFDDVSCYLGSYYFGTEKTHFFRHTE